MRYFFDFDECGDITTDEEGRDLPDLDTARERAVCEARELMSGSVRRGSLCLEFTIAVRDETGNVVLTIPFSEALDPKG